MLSLRTALQALLVPFFLAGCISLVDRPALAQSLPDGVKWDDYVEKDWMGRKITVGMKLARLGAYSGPDGKLYDRSGRRIDFFRHYDGGANPGEKFFEQARQHLEEMKKTCTVIEISRDPDLPLPV